MRVNELEPSMLTTEHVVEIVHVSKVKIRLD